MPTSRHRILLAATGAAAVLTVGAAIAVPAVVNAAPSAPAAPAAADGTVEAEAIKCADEEGNRPFYDGKSASKVYDETFTHGVPVPKANLDTHTPQGVGTWHDWDGKGHTLLLVSAYRDGAKAQIIGIDQASGKHVGTVAIADGHVGGITVARSWAYVGNGDHVRKYSLAKLRGKMTAAGVPYLEQEGKSDQVYGASFLSAYGDSVWAGRFNDAHHDKMYQYKIDANGELHQAGGPWEIPVKTQGLLVTETHFIYSTSYGRDNRSNIYVVKRGSHDLPKQPKCFRAPSMAEGLTEYAGFVYLAFESGSHLYRGDSRTRNVISELHKAPLSRLLAMAP